MLVPTRTSIKQELWPAEGPVAVTITYIQSLGIDHQMQQLIILVSSIHMQIPCQNLQNATICQEDFFLSGGLCKPKCSTWLMYSQTAEIASLVIIGTATVIGILTTVVIIILSFVQFKSL